MLTKVTTVLPGGPLSKTIIAPGDILRKINGNVIGDVLDYQFHSYDRRLLIEFTGSDGNIKIIRLSKPEGADLGLEFEAPLMDKQHSCANKCIFCFIDQLPKGMRESLYYKDDDIRLSFLEGNYVTLTNLGDSDIERIISLRISPINVSIHTLDPGLRRFMLGKNKNRDECGSEAEQSDNKYVQMLARAGIILNCQIVCCPGINDNKELKKTIEGLMRLGRSINSVSVVPVGLTKHREGLHKLQPFDRKLALQTVRLVGQYGKRALKKRGSRVFYCADELYMMAGLRLPSNGFYEDYPQLENGVGMMRLFITEFKDAMRSYSADEAAAAKSRKNEMPQPSPVLTVVTGKLAAPYLTKLLQDASMKYDTINCRVCPITNNFFGESITVSGLITGSDIIGQLSGTDLGKRLLIPQNMLRHGGDVFLDDVTIHDLSNALGVPVQVVGQSGKDFFNALLQEHDDA